jgi:SET domain-containing protein
LRERIVEHRESSYESEGNYGTYVFHLDEGDMCIDATRQGGLARSINHSCDRNCEARSIRGPDGKWRIVIYSKRRIDPCEELCYDYRLP